MPNCVIFVWVMEIGRITDTRYKSTLENISGSEFQAVCGVKEILGVEELGAEWKPGNYFPWVDRKCFPFPGVR